MKKVIEGIRYFTMGVGVMAVIVAIIFILAELTAA